MAGKEVVVYLEPYRAQVKNGEYGRRARVALAEGMYLPKARNEAGDVRNHIVLRKTLVAESALLFDIIVKCASQILPVQVVHCIAAEHPFAFGDIVITNFSGMFENAVEHPSVHGNISVSAEIERSGGKNLCNIGRDFVSFLLFVIIVVVLRLRLIVGFYQLSGLVNVNFSLDMPAGRGL